MAALSERDHYLPLRMSELVEALAADEGFSEDAGGGFRQLAAMLGATFHFEYHQLLEELKDDYASFDPDSATQSLRALTSDERAAKMDRFFDGFARLMERGNFKHLDKQAIEEATKAVSDWGLNMDVDFENFERLHVYYRGDAMGRRTRRRWYRFFREESVQLPIYQRLVLLVKLKPSRRLPDGVDTNDIFIKLFKDIPKMDVEMLLPGARMIMPGISRLKIGGSFLSGLIYVLYTIIKHVITAGVAVSIYFFWGPLVALAGYSYRQYYGYQTTKNAFTLQLTQSLYYQTLGNNLGVIQHLIDEVEEQEGRESVLAYYHLCRHAPPEGLTEQEIDVAVERHLKRKWNLDVDFEVRDALGKLCRLRLLVRNGQRCQAVPLDQALHNLDESWDNFFKFNRAGAADQVPSSPLASPLGPLL